MIPNSEKTKAYMRSAGSVVGMMSPRKVAIAIFALVAGWFPVIIGWQITVNCTGSLDFAGVCSRTPGYLLEAGGGIMVAAGAALLGSQFKRPKAP